MVVLVIAVEVEVVVWVELVVMLATPLDGFKTTKTTGMVPSGVLTIKKGTMVVGEALLVLKYIMLQVRKHSLVAGV